MQKIDIINVTLMYNFYSMIKKKYELEICKTNLKFKSINDNNNQKKMNICSNNNIKIHRQIKNETRK